MFSVVLKNFLVEVQVNSKDIDVKVEQRLHLTYVQSQYHRVFHCFNAQLRRNVVVIAVAVCEEVVCETELQDFFVAIVVVQIELELSRDHERSKVSDLTMLKEMFSFLKWNYMSKLIYKFPFLWRDAMIFFREPSIAENPLQYLMVLFYRRLPKSILPGS